LSSIEATSDELLGAYTRAEDDAMTLAFEGRGKKRLNRVFDVIGFVYPDYSYPSWKKAKKRKAATLAISVVPKGKKIKVLTHRPRYIETATVPKLGEGTSSTAEAEQPAPASPREELAELSKIPATGSVETPKHGAEAKGKAAKEPELGETVVLPKILIPPAEPELPKVSKAPAITPKRRRMASVLDAVLESTRASTPAPAKGTAEAATVRVEIEVRPSVPTKAEPAGTEQRTEQRSSDASLALDKKDAPEKVKSPTPEAPSKDLDFIIRHASGKRLSEEEIAEAKHYARELKYPKGALLYNGTYEDDFLYCLSDNKEISICWEMAKTWDFRSLKLAFLPCQRMTLQTALHTIVWRYGSYGLINRLSFVIYSRVDPLSPFFLQGLILSNALRAQKNAEDESCQIALGNLRSEVIKLRNEALEKDKILLSLVDRVKKDEAKFNAQSKAHRAEVENLKKKLVEANENFELAKVKQEIIEWSNARLEKNVEELRESKERCFEKSLDCVRKLKISFAKVGAYSSEEKFIRGDPEWVIDWIGEEAKAFEEILSDRGDICAFTGARGVAAILEKAGCGHVKAMA
jgi:hypothetical protein